MGGIFYVYEHWRPDKDVCFYVGKGKGKRARVMYARSRYHFNIQNKLARLGMCVEVRMVAYGLSEDAAYALEIERIAFWRGVGVKLANKTAGGDVNTDPSVETRALMRKAKLGRKLSASHKQKISASTKIALADPARRARISEKSKAYHNRPDIKAAKSKRFREMPRTKEHYEKVAAALRGRKLSPEHIEAVRLGNLGRKQSVQEIERRRAANTGKKRSPEFCARMRAAWTSERRAAQSARTAALWTDEFTEVTRNRVKNHPKDARGRMLPVKDK